MGATVFVDHHSDHVYVYLMRNLTLEETLLAKDAYERFLNSNGVSVQAYHADNGRFADKGFRDDCKSNNQTITFCGVGGHHQNGIAERKIKDLTLGGRTLLLHAKRMLPEYITTILWPFAIKCHEDQINNLVHRADERTPYQILLDLDASPINVKDFYTFGFPCYVLDHRLQSGQGKMPKWDPQARLGIYVGRSPAHASNVGLILNPRTGHISPQFHVVYDDNFTTVPYLRTGQVPSHWADLVRESSELNQVDNQKTTWNSLSVNDSPEDGDFNSDPDFFPSEQIASAEDNEKDTVERSSLMLNPEGASATRRVSFLENASSENHMPEALNLETSGLRWSKRIKQQ